MPHFQRKIVKIFDITERDQEPGQEVYRIAGVCWFLSYHRTAMEDSIAVNLKLGEDPVRGRVYGARMMYKLNDTEGRNVFTSKKFTLNTKTSRRVKKVEITESCQLEFVVLEMTGELNIMFRDFRMFPESDVNLTVQNWKFHVSREQVSENSEVLNGIIGNAEKDACIPITFNCDPGDFQIFLEMLYGENTLKHENFIKVADIAKFFKDANVLKKCEDLLIKMGWFLNKTHCEWINEYQFHNYERHVMSQKKDFEGLCEFKTQDVNEMSDRTLESMIDRLYEIGSQAE